MKTYFQMISELKGYEPKDKHFTSNEEIERLNKHFGLEGMTVYEMQNLRDMFMALYFAYRDWFSCHAMWSVTAVIDHYKFQKMGEI